MLMTPSKTLLKPRVLKLLNFHKPFKTHARTSPDQMINLVQIPQPFKAKVKFRTSRAWYIKSNAPLMPGDGRSLLKFRVDRRTTRTKTMFVVPKSTLRADKFRSLVKTCDRLLGGEPRRVYATPLGSKY